MSNDAVRARIVERLARDAEGGKLESVDFYRSLFPGFEAVVDEEYPATSAGRGEGTRLGHYRIVRHLGTGGQGSVFEAIDEKLGRHVALKTLDGLPALRADAIGRLRREARIAASLDHPDICPTYEIDTVDGITFIAMKLVDGRSLYETLGVVGAAPRDFDRIARVFERIALAVDAIHAEGVVHRDLKPANILVTADDAPIVMDFGVAVATASDTTRLTAAGGVPGTLAYMAPELVGGSTPAADARTDVWSLGVTFFEVLASRRPFDAPTTEQLIIAITTSEPESPRRIRRDVPSELAVIALTALDKDRSRRYGTAREFALDLRRYLDRKPILAKPAGIGLRLSRWVRRNPAVAALTAAILVILVGSVVIVSLQNVDLIRQRERIRAHNDTLTLSALEAEAARLWPAEPALVPAIKDLIGRLDALVARAPQTERTLLAPAEGPDDVGGHLELAQFVATLSSVRNPESGLRVRLDRRLRFAETVRATTVDGYEREWTELSSLIMPQLGLIPLGRDPVSKLEEFLHLASHDGDPKTFVRDEQGRLPVDEKSGVIFVLVPGGKTQLGATSRESEFRHDPDADPNEAPVHEVELAPYFIAKHELTQGQWFRMTALVEGRGEIPSFFTAKTRITAPGDITWGHPVETINWNRASDLLARFGLLLPTEAQWEHAARGGTETRFWTGDEGASLAKVANLEDRRGKIDGFPVHGPVWALPPNPFGMHGMPGNVREWCRDAYKATSYQEPVAPGDGLRMFKTGGKPHRVIRDGSYELGAVMARASHRDNHLEAYAEADLGLRAARAVDR